MNLTIEEFHDRETCSRKLKPYRCREIFMKNDSDLFRTNLIISRFFYADMIYTLKWFAIIIFETVLIITLILFFINI